MKGSRLPFVSKPVEEVKRASKEPVKKLPDSSKFVVEIEHSVERFVLIMRQIMNAYVSLTMFCGTKALDQIFAIPEIHRETGFVLSMAAKAHFELHQYEKASIIFKKIRQIDPNRLTSMDLYGTCLWHLKKKVDLSLLGQEMEMVDRLAPETWFNPSLL